MRQKQPLPEGPDKGGGSAEKPLTQAEAKKAMVRFESLTRRLLSVSKEQLQTEQANYEREPKKMKRK